MCKRGKWERQSLSPTALIPSGLLPTPTPPPPSGHLHLRGPVTALTPVTPASDVSFGQADKSWPEEPGSSGAEAWRSAAGEKEARPALGISSNSEQRLRTLPGKKLVLNPPKVRPGDDFSFFFGSAPRLMGSQFPDQGLNPGHGSESPES